MGYLFDSAGVSSQLSSASAGRLDTGPVEFQAGGAGAGPHNSILNNFSFGQSRLNADQTATAEQMPWWTWALLGLGVLIVLAKVFKRH